MMETAMELLERFAQGDMDAFETLFRRHQADVFRWIVTILRDPATAEDLTVETFWRIHCSHARFDPSRSFEAWARRIATNLAIEHLRKSGREILVGSEELAMHPDPPERNGVARSQLRDAIRRAFSALPAKLKAVASLILLEDKAYSDAAVALGISVMAVKSREFRAVRHLRNSLKEMGIEL
jgi:RNA polymerase sigma-70 factor, ECF subfamily